MFTRLSLTQIASWTISRSWARTMERPRVTKRKIFSALVLGQYFCATLLFDIGEIVMNTRHNYTIDTCHGFIWTLDACDHQWDLCTYQCFALVGDGWGFDHWKVLIPTTWGHFLCQIPTYPLHCGNTGTVATSPNLLRKVSGWFPH